MTEINCPYSLSGEVLATKKNNAPVFLCENDECRGPVLLCSNCGKPNRSLARYCHYCGEGISYLDQEKAMLPKLKREKDKRYKKRVKNYVGQEKQDFSLLYSYRGYLIIGSTTGNIFVTISLVIEYSLAKFKVDGVPLTITPSPMPDDASLIITTLNKVYKLSFLPDISFELLVDFSDRGNIKGPAFLTSAGLAAVVAAGQNTEILTFNDGQIEATRLSGVTSPALCVNGFLYIMSTQHLYKFDVGDKRLDKIPLPDEDWNLKLAPVYDGQTQQIYIYAAKHIYHSRTSAADNDAPMIVPDNEFTNFRMTINEQKLIVAHGGGLTILNYYDGGVVWDLKEKLHLLLPAANFPPRIIGNHIFFIALNDKSNEEINAIPIKGKNEYADIISVDEFTHIALEPVVWINWLVVADASGGKLVMYELGQL